LVLTIGLRMHSGGLVAESVSGVTSYRWPSPTNKQRCKGEMMDKIEQVKNILYQYDWENNTKAMIIEDSTVATQICQLFEPKISPYALPSQAYGEYFTPPEPQPDEGRFLTDEERKIAGILSEWQAKLKEWGI